MSELNRDKMGMFISQLRKEKNMTQKELAERLFISAKAISKWETGVTIPSVDMLMPLADILEVSVTELLQGEKFKEDITINKDNVEELVKKAISMKEVESIGNLQNRKNKITLFVVSFVISMLEVLYLLVTDFNKYYLVDFVPFMIVGIVISFYFTFIVKEQIPTFYDNNKINYYTDGFMRINMPGLYFNNSNWPHISGYIRIWSNMLMILTPIFFYIFDRFIPIQLSGFIFLFFLLVTLLVPIYIIGKRYE